LARLVVIEYKPSRVKGGLFLALGVAALGLLFVKPMAGAPLGAKVIGGFIGVIFALIGFWELAYGPRLASTLRRLGESVNIEGDKLLLPGPLRLRSGSLRVDREWRGARSPRSGASPTLYTEFEESNDGEATLESLDPSSFRGSVSILAGFSHVATGLVEEARLVAREGAKGLLTAPDVVEWVRVPAFEVVDERYSVPAASIVIALIPRVSHEVSISRDRLVASRGREVASAELRVSDGAVEGVLSYTKPLEGRSRAARLELEVARRGFRYKSTIARIDRPGSVEFKWRPSVEEEVYILMTTQNTISPVNLLRKAGVETPLLAGAAWEGVSEAKLRLVLEIPMARDVVDEAHLVVRPILTTTHS